MGADRFIEKFVLIEKDGDIKDASEQEGTFIFDNRLWEIESMTDIYASSNECVLWVKDEKGGKEYLEVIISYFDASGGDVTPYALKDAIASYDSKFKDVFNY